MVPRVVGSTWGFHHHALAFAPLLGIHAAAKRTDPPLTNGARHVRRAFLVSSVCPSVVASVSSLQPASASSAPFATQTAAKRLGFTARTLRLTKRPLLLASMLVRSAGLTSGFHHHPLGGLSRSLMVCSLIGRAREGSAIAPKAYKFRIRS